MFDEGWRSRLVLVVSLASLIGTIWVIAACSIVPMVDLPIWLEQGWLFGRMLRGTLPPDYYLFPGPVPNSASTVLIGLLTLVFNVNVAGKIVIVIAILLFFVGAWRVIGSIGAPRGHVIFFLPVILIPTHFLFSGELSHLIGLGLSFFYLEHLLESLDDPERLSAGSLAALASLTFISSFTAYAPIALITFVIAIGINRRVLWKKLVLANVAPVVMFAWYVIARAAGGEVSLHAWEPWSDLRMFSGNMIDLMAPFQGFAPWVEASTLRFRIFAAANAAFCIALAALVLWSIWRWFRGDTKHNVVLAAAIVSLFATVVFGRTFASAAFGERFVIPALMILSAWTASQWRMPAHLDSALVTAAVLLLVARGIYLQQTVIPVSQALSGDLASLNSARSPEEFAKICADTTSRSWTAAGGPTISHFLPNNAVAIRIMYYDCIESGAAVPIWPSGIFRYAGTGSYDDQCSWTQCLN